MSSPLDIRTSKIRLGARALKVLSIELLVIEGPDRGLRVPVDAVARVGSAAANDLTLADVTVSRVHCELRPRADSIAIKDCGSTNGTFVEGVRIRDAEVQPGAAVRVGNSVFRIVSVSTPSFVEVSDHTSFGELVGASLEMRRVYAILERLARSDSTLLIEGETGTGKELAARSLHRASSRAAGPFVPIDCGAVPEQMMESELFGHAEGALFGAARERKGVFEDAHGGTLFFDEIDAMPLSAQAKLIRALETRSIKRIGESVERPVDVRVIAATNRSLAVCANQGTFREDLYYRLAVVEVKLPALRLRVDDIPALAAHFYERLGAAESSLPSTFVQMLATRGWPGNVRELRNFIERSVSLGFIEQTTRGLPALREQAMPTPGFDGLVPLDLPLKEARQAWTEKFEVVYVRGMLEQTHGNVTRAAERAGVNRRFLQRLVTRLGLRASELDDPPDAST
ncbi:MAG TPA: sigma 54-interacting transcriptional regulator [Polyangiales bacterium]|nr:sigma 54-interacting transcriptional regulator [Polyangiales bacterium]